MTHRRGHVGRAGWGLPSVYWGADEWYFIAAGRARLCVISPKHGCYAAAPLGSDEGGLGRQRCQSNIRQFRSLGSGDSRRQQMGGVTLPHIPQAILRSWGSAHISISFVGPSS